MKMISFSHLTHNKLFLPGVGPQRDVAGPAGGSVIIQFCTSSARALVLNLTGF